MITEEEESVTTPSESSPTPIDMQAVIDVIGEDPLSKALFERAQFLALVRAQDKELRYLRAAVQEQGNPPSGGGS